MFHYTAIAKSKLLQRLMFWATLFNQQGHIFAICLGMKASFT